MAVLSKDLSWIMIAVWLLTTAFTAEGSGFCANGTAEVVVEVLTDPFPVEASWDIKDCAGTVVASGENYTKQETLYLDSVCLEETEECDGLYIRSI